MRGDGWRQSATVGWSERIERLDWLFQLSRLDLHCFRTRGGDDDASFLPQHKSVVLLDEGARTSIGGN